MTDPISLENNWILAISRKTKTDPLLVEKVIRALWLLEGLVDSGLPFTFKGGTALMLMLHSQRRLSIDIDIVVKKKDNTIATSLSRIAEEKGFIRVEEQKRDIKSSINKKHYKYFYKPVTQNSHEAYVLLDVLFGPSGYHKLATLSY